ncbi:MAG: hypothetical protein ACT4TC_17640 [Myxococcaceae bacterium]
MPDNRERPRVYSPLKQSAQNTLAAGVFSKRMNRKGPTIALAVSLLLHLGLGLFLRSRPAPTPLRPVVAQRPFQLEVLYDDATPRTPPPPTEPTRQEGAGSLGERSVGQRAAAGETLGREDLRRGASTTGVNAEAGGIPLPSLRGPDGRSAVANPGRTLHPGEGTGDSLAQEGERVRGRVQDFAEGQLAATRLSDGSYHTYFTQLRHALEESVASPPPFRANNFGQSLVRNYTRSMRAFGATGNPSLTADGRTGDPLNPSRLAQERSGLVDPTATMVAQGNALRQAAGEGAAPALVAIVDLYQGPNGELRRIELSQPSGVPEFDRYVMNEAPKALGSLVPPPPEALHGKTEQRTTWAFEGRVVYLRHVRDMDLKKDAWYLALAAPAAALTGSFEETTGDVQVVDLRNPSYRCTVRLLRVY